MKNKKGFTLIELLAVIIILGILLVIAIPSVTNYISDSRKSSYVKSAKLLVSAAKNMVNEGKFNSHDTSITYYIDSRCLKTENANKSPYGEFDPAYVIFTFDGKGYDYYWTSRDTTGQGVKKIINIDKLQEDDIISGIQKNEILHDVGIDGRPYYQLIDNNCAIQEKDEVSAFINSEIGELNIVCKRATSLHQEKCTQSSKFCSTTVGNGNYTTFGQKGTRGVLTPGDAFDCDVNGDGHYDAGTERFYYVSDYFDPNASKDGSSVYDEDIAVLVYYTNYKSGSGPVASGQSYAKPQNNYKGPTTAVSDLPTTDEWSNVYLKQTNRQLLAEYLGNHNLSFVKQNANSNNKKTLEEFDYSGRAARLLTAQEVMNACGESQVGDAKQNVLTRCLYLLENTKYSSGSSPVYGFWLETAYGVNFTAVFRVNSEKFEILSGDTNATNKGVRPAIEVEKIYMEY